MLQTLSSEYTRNNVIIENIPSKSTSYSHALINTSFQFQ